MKLNILIIIIVIFSAFLTSAIAKDCQIVTTWGEDDAAYFNVNPDSVTAFTISNEYDVNLASSYTEFFMVTNHPSINWQYGVSIRSYNDPTYAAKMYSDARGVATICQEVTGSYFTASAYYSCTLTGNFYLYATYRDRFVIKLNISNNKGPKSSTYLLPTMLDGLQMAKALIDSKCTSVNKEPFIALLPLPTDGWSFQNSILAGKGFQILFQDPDGMEDINWNSFNVFVAGNNTTSHFLDVIFRSDMGLRAETTRDKSLLYITPTPAKLMEEHDMFAIPFNGDYLIELEICDKGGLCARSTNMIYFGPYVSLPGDVIHRACIAEGERGLWFSQLVIGNTGMNCKQSDIYILLHSDDNPDEYWSYSIKYGEQDWRKGVTPYFLSLPISTGYHLSPQNFDMLYINFLEGPYELIMGIVDNDSNAIGFDKKEITLCIPQ